MFSRARGQDTSTEAAENAGRKDILAAMEPSLKTQFRLWWDLMS